MFEVGKTYKIKGGWQEKPEPECYVIVLMDDGKAVRVAFAGSGNDCEDYVRIAAPYLMVVTATQLKNLLAK